MGFKGGFSSTRKPSIQMREEGQTTTQTVTTLVVSNGTLGTGSNGTVSLETGGGGLSGSFSGSDGQIAVFSGSSTVVGYSELTYDQTAINLTGNINAQDVTVRNIYTGDFHMKNERGDWTIVEESAGLVVRNNKTGEKFKLLMEKIED